MPNHVTTVCTVTGSPNAVLAFREKHITKTEPSDRKPSGEDYFNFKTVIPMPDCIENSQSSSQQEIGILAIIWRWRERTKVALFGDAAADGIRAEIESFRWIPAEARASAEALCAWLEANPSRTLDGKTHSAIDLGAQSLIAIAKTGYDSWYGWSCANWGTKWGGYSYEERIVEPEKFVFKFETAWSFPEPIFEKLRELHPELVFSVVSFDEGWNFACRGSFGGPNDFEHVDANDELYEQVYGRKPDVDGDESEDDDEATT